MTSAHINQFFALSKKYVKTYFAISISLFLFVLFFQPFTTEVFNFENQLLFYAGHGLICFIFLMLSQITFQSLLLKEKQNPNGYSLLFALYYMMQVIGISLAFTFYVRFVGQIQTSFIVVLRALVMAIGVSVAMGIQRNFNDLQDSHMKLMKECRSLQDRMKQFSENYSNKYIEIISDNESENFRLQVSDIVFVKSADNYVEVGYHEHAEVKKKMVRTTLKNIEMQLREFNNFIRTHRTSIVNIQNIEKLHKNFNTYWLSLDETNETIPVSRQYLMAVKDVL